MQRVLYDRVFGFYRPFGVRKNVFILFRTGNPYAYHHHICKEFNKMEEATEIGEMMGFDFKGTIIYSQKTHVDYMPKFIELLNQLEKDGNQIHRHDKEMYFPAIELADGNCNEEYLNKVLRDL
jgi:hypothetical protein